MQASTLPLSLNQNQVGPKGFGSNLTLQGNVECDAAIMDQGSAFGSVGAVSGVKNPIQLARAVLSYSQIPDPLGRVAPLTLVGPGAVEFATRHATHVELVPTESMISSDARIQWERWKERLDQASANPNEANALQDTVGAIGWTVSSSVAAGVSSGGLLLKLPGRIGEAAFYGAGCWAQGAPMLACSISGAGESITRHLLAKTLCEKLCTPDVDVHEALRSILQDDFASSCRNRGEQPDVGLILLIVNDKNEARLWCAFTTASMAIGYYSPANMVRPTALILRQSTGSTNPLYITAISL